MTSDDWSRFGGALVLVLEIASCDGDTSDKQLDAGGACGCDRSADCHGAQPQESDGGKEDDDGGGGSGTSSGAGDGSACPSSGGLVTAQHYEYTFTLDTGYATSRIDIEGHLTEEGLLELDSALPVSNAAWNGAPLSTNQSSGLLRACDAFASCDIAGRWSSDTVVPEQPFESGAGFVRNVDAHGNPTSYLRGWVEQCDLFGPCDDRTDVLSGFHFIIKHAPGEQVLCPGRLLPGQTSTECIIDGTRSPTYSSFFIASNNAWVRKPFTTVQGMDVVFYEAPGGALAQSVDKVHVDAFLSWITGYLGPLPYGNDLRVAALPMDWLGFEHPSNIVLNDLLPTMQSELANMTMHTLMHEIAHQWAGNRTTLTTSLDFVWKEAIAEYLVYVYEDENMASSVAARTRAYWDRIAKFAPNYPVPMDVPPPHLLTVAGYTLGAGPMLMFLQLEPFLGRSTILEAIRGFLEPAGTRSVEDLRAALESASGADLQDYFSVWIYGSEEPEWPYFQVDIMPSSSGSTVTVTQKTPSMKAYPCVLEIQLETPTGSVTREVYFALNGPPKSATVSVESSGPISSVVVDPRHMIVNRNIAYSSAPTVSEPRLPIWLF